MDASEAIKKVKVRTTTASGREVWKIETLARSEWKRVFTIESGPNTWYHPSNVRFPINMGHGIVWATVPEKECD